MPGGVLLLSPAVLLGCLVVLAVTVAATCWSLGRVAAQVRASLGGPPGVDLDRERRRQATRVLELTQRIDQLETRLAILEEAMAGSLQRLGLVRFSAFEDTGSDQSFALALVDAGDNGVILTSLSGRSETRVYAKPLLAGRSPHKLSAEELAAVARAREGKGWTSLVTGKGGAATGGRR